MHWMFMIRVHGWTQLAVLDSGAGQVCANNGWCYLRWSPYGRYLARWNFEHGGFPQVTIANSWWFSSIQQFYGDFPSNIPGDFPRISIMPGERLAVWLTLASAWRCWSSSMQSLLWVKALCKVPRFCDFQFGWVPSCKLTWKWKIIYSTGKPAWKPPLKWCSARLGTTGGRNSMAKASNDI